MRNAMAAQATMTPSLPTAGRADDRDTQDAPDDDLFFDMDDDDHLSPENNVDEASPLDIACAGVHQFLKRLSCRSSDPQELKLWRVVDSILTSCPSLVGSEDNADASSILASRLGDLGFTARTVATIPTPGGDYLRRNAQPHHFVAVCLESGKKNSVVVVDLHFR